jgi:hypothetical protein
LNRFTRSRGSHAETDRSGPYWKDLRETKGDRLCGAARVADLSEPKPVGQCHCRKHSGTFLFAAAIFDREAVSITGETRD